MSHVLFILFFKTDCSAVDVELADDGGAVGRGREERRRRRRGGRRLPTTTTKTTTTKTNPSFFFLTRVHHFHSHPTKTKPKPKKRNSFLTDPTFLGDMGLDVKKRDASQLFDPQGNGKRDALLVIAYPSFNVNEMIAVDDAWKAMTARAAANNKEDGKDGGVVVPIVIFNGELERIFSGYYPPLFYRRLARVASAKDGGILASPGSDATYYIKNFKGLNPGILYRCWWVVLLLSFFF